MDGLQYLQSLVNENDRGYRRLRYGEWLAESEEEQTLRRLAETYHEVCDAYERKVCTGVSPWTGGIMPNNDEEFGLVGKYSRQVRERLIVEGAAHGLSRDQVERAIQRYCKG